MFRLSQRLSHRLLSSVPARPRSFSAAGEENVPKSPGLLSTDVYDLDCESEDSIFYEENPLFYFTEDEESFFYKNITAGTERESVEINKINE